MTVGDEAVILELARVSRICRGFRSGASSGINATRPATSPRRTMNRLPFPSAARERGLDILAGNQDRCGQIVRVIRRNGSTPVTDAGNLPSLELIRGATITTPRVIATFKSRPKGDRGTARLRLITFVFWSSANWSALASVKLLQTARLPSTGVCQQARSAINTDCGATPTIPTPSSARAAMMPATAVPCVSATASLPSTKFRAIATRSRRSGWSRSTPESISATRTFFPVVI